MCDGTGSLFDVSVNLMRVVVEYSVTSENLLYPEMHTKYLATRDVWQKRAEATVRTCIGEVARVVAAHAQCHKRIVFLTACQNGSLIW